MMFFKFHCKLTAEVKVVQWFEIFLHLNKGKPYSYFQLKRSRKCRLLLHLRPIIYV